MKFFFPTILLIAVFGLAPNAAGANSVTATPASLSFGNVSVGSTSLRTVTLKNTGLSSVSISAATLVGAGFSYSGLSLPFILTAGNSIVLNVTFAPATAGVFSGSITVTNGSTVHTAISLSGTGISHQLSASLLTLSFGEVALAKSGTLALTLTNTGTGSISVLRVQSTSAAFTVSGPALPLTVTPGQSANFNVTFTPTSAASFSSLISIQSTASDSPNTVGALGIGVTDSGDAAAPCVGSAITQTPVNVTAELSEVGAGVTVTQVTNDQQNWNTYQDVPAYSALANVMTYNSYNDGPINMVTSANLDGSNAQTISGSQQGKDNFVTLDGRFVIYQGQNPNLTGDIYAVPISEEGSCQQNRLTHTNWAPVAPLGAIVLSTSSIDPASGKNVIAYSGDTLLHRVLDDGTALSTVTLGDPENTDVFHRMRLNPVFPTMLWYKRDQPLPNPDGAAQPEIWVVNLNSPNTVYSLAGTTPVDHATWSPDGTQLGYHIGGVWYLANVLNPSGTFNLNSTGTFTSTKIGPPSGFGVDANYCNWAPDGTVYVCTGGESPGSPVYLMSLNGSQTRYLSATDSSGTIDAGLPKARFLDMQHIMFSSDRTGTPQIYGITGFTTTFP